MRRMNPIAGILLFGLTMLAACAEDQTMQGEAMAAAEPELPSANAVIETRQLAKPADYNGVDNAQALFAQLPPRDRAMAEEFYGKYDPVVMQFGSHEQLAWMINNGYPMPEDVVAASLLTDSELLDLHRSGDVKAGIFYLDRRAYPSVNASNKISKPERSQLNSIANDVLVSGSPFAGYAYARYEESKGNSHSALAGYAWSGWLGDRRAMEAMARAQRKLGSLNSATPLEPAVAVIAFATLMRTAHSLKPALFSRKVEPIPYSLPP